MIAGKSICCVLCTLALTAATTAGQAGAPSPLPLSPARERGRAAGGAGKTSDAEIAKLIAQLGSDDADQRAAASRRLAAMDAALSRLREAAKAPDAEVRRRAAAAVAIIEHRLSEQLTKEAVDEVNRDGLDVFVDRMVREKGYATAERYKAAMRLATALAKRAVKAGAAEPAVLKQDFLALPEATGPNLRVFAGARVRIEGTGEGLTNVRSCLLFSSGSIKQLSITQRSILFVNGDIDTLTTTIESIIICNGTIKRCSSPRGSIIYCNGVIENMSLPRTSAIFVRGELRALMHPMSNVIEAKKLMSCTMSQGNTYLNRDSVPASSSMNDRFSKVTPSVLELFRFFDPARLGLEFTMADGDAKVEKLAKDKPFARAGLQKGDLILAVNRQKFLTADDFTRLLRLRLSTGSAQLKVQRGDRIVQVSVDFAR